MCDPNFADNTCDLAICKSGHFHHPTEKLTTKHTPLHFFNERTSLAAFIVPRVI